MQLPNAAQAVVDIAKLRDYCLSTHHEVGQHKARVFAAALGLTAADAEVLQAALLSVALIYDATLTHSDGYGHRYVIDFTMQHKGKAAQIHSSWIVRTAEDFPRLTSCYVL